MASGFVFRTALDSDFDRIMKFLFDHFYHEEPFTRASGATAEEMRPIFAEMVHSGLKNPFSTIVICELTGDVAAVLLNSVWRRGEHSEVVEEGENNNENKPHTEAIQKLIQILDESHVDFWNLCPSDVNVVLYREISSVGLPWQRKGIATRMVTESLTPSRVAEFKLDGIVSATSSFANQKLLAKQGFRCLKEYPYKNIVVTDDGSNAMRLNFKRIEDFVLV